MRVVVPISRFVAPLLAVLSLAQFSVPARADGIKVLEAKPFAQLSDLFQKQKQGWVGADGAYSIKLNDETTFWTFGDTWMGTIENNHRLPGVQMINNTAAIHRFTTTGNSEIKFLWAKEKEKPRSLWVAKEEGKYFWPGDGIALDGKVYMFLHKIGVDNKRPSPFNFYGVSDVLVKIENPLDPPESWRTTYADLGNDAEKLEYGTATVFDGDYMYIYCSNIAARSGLDAHPSVLARIAKNALETLALGEIEYYCQPSEDQSTDAIDKLAVSIQKGGSSNVIVAKVSETGARAKNGNGVWKRKLDKPIILIPDAAPEMSVSRVNGIDGFVAVYMPPMSNEIMLRQAPRPEGPWGPRVKLYECPETKGGKDDSTFVYSGKAHPELSQKPGELIITYCRNSKEFARHMDTANVYFPQAIKVSLEQQ